jgi:hypothetical protein
MAIIVPGGVGGNPQPTDTELTAIASVTSAANKVPYFTGSGTADVADLPSFGRTLIANTTAQLARDDLVAYGREMGYAERTTSHTSSNTGASTADKISGLSVTVTGTGRAVAVEFYARQVRNSGSGIWNVIQLIQDGVAAQTGVTVSATTTINDSVYIQMRKVLTDTVSYTFEVGVTTQSATCTVVADATGPMSLSVTER